MQRNVGGIGTRSSTGAIRRAHICAECGKSFRNGEDLLMHAEVCMLDAFEMEASAMHAAAVEKADQSRSVSSRVAYVSSGGDSSGTLATGRAVSASAAAVPSREVRAVADERHLVGEELEEEYEEDSDYEPPPELELAEPAAKKYKRVFPVGEDGKQIRPKMECPTCGLVLYRHNFSTHFRIHTGELPFQCSFCDKRFRTSSALTVHTRCHTGERPYECPHCNYCCITKRNLDRHIINNHVRKNSRTRGDYYYAPRGAGACNYYGDDFDDAMDDIDDENLEEAELEEEAGISRIAEHRASHHVSPMTTKNNTQNADRGTATTTNTTTDSAAQSGGKGQGVADEVAEADAGDDGGAKQPSYEPAYKRFVTGAEAVPILDGPKGVYGDPEAEATGTTEPTAGGDSDRQDQQQKGNEKTDTTTSTTTEKEHESPNTT